MSATSLREAALTALHRVHDPCSLAARLPVDIVDLGLVLAVDVEAAADGGHARVELCLTSGSCTFGGLLVDAVRAELAAVHGITSVDVVVDPAHVWEPGRMAASARRERERHHRTGAARTGLRPRQWQDAVATPEAGAGPG